MPAMSAQDPAVVGWFDELVERQGTALQPDAPCRDLSVALPPRQQPKPHGPLELANVMPTSLPRSTRRSSPSRSSRAATLLDEPHEPPRASPSARVQRPCQPPAGALSGSRAGGVGWILGEHAGSAPGRLPVP